MLNHTVPDWVTARDGSPFCFFGVPALVAILLLPLIVVMTPFPWNKQTKKLREMEQRLGRLEVAHKALARRTRLEHTDEDHAARPLPEPAAEPPAAPVSKPATEPDTAPTTHVPGEPEHWGMPAGVTVAARHAQLETQRSTSTAPPLTRAADAGPDMAVHPPVTAPPMPAPPPPLPATEHVAVPPSAAIPPPPAIEHAAVSPSAATPAAGVIEQAISTRRQAEAALRRQAKAALRPHVPSDWESRVGRSWLNIIGIVVLVVGIVLLIGYSLQYLGPAGKVGVGLSSAVMLLGVGWLLERLPRYRAFARALIGGGWALAYFTAYAAHNVPAAKVIQDPLWAMPVLILVAFGMIAHSFRYRSQVVTGLGYGLAFFAIAISPISSYSLAAIALLGGSMMTVLRIQPWYHLALAGVIGSYLCFGLWYRSTATPDALVSQEHFLIGVLVLGVYWLLFALSPFVRRPASSTDRAAILLLSIANGTGFLGFGVALARLSAEPSPLPGFMLLTALAFAALAYLHLRIRLHMTFLLHALAATILLALSAPLQLAARDISFDWLALPWAVEAGVVLAVGLYLREIWLRIASYLLAGLVAIALFGLTLQGGAEGRQLVLWVSVPLVVAFFFYSFELLKARAGHGDVLAQARPVGLAFGYLATALLAAFVWVEIPRVYVAIAWLTLGVVLFEIGVRKARPHLRFQGLSLLAGAAYALVFIDMFGFGVSSTPQGTSLWLMVSAVAAARGGRAALA